MSDLSNRIQRQMGQLMGHLMGQKNRNLQKSTKNPPISVEISGFSGTP